MEMTHKKAVPDYGEGGGGAVGRGKREQTQKNDSDLCTQTCPYRLAKLGTSLRVRGKLTLRKKEFKFIYVKMKNNEMTHTKKLSPLVGKQANRFSRRGATL